MIPKWADDGSLFLSMLPDVAASNRFSSGKEMYIDKRSNHELEDRLFGIIIKGVS